MQNNQQNYFGAPPNTNYAAGMDSQSQNLPPRQSPLPSVADQSSYAMIGMLGNMFGVRPSMASSLPTNMSVPNSLAAGSSDQVAQMYANMMRQMPGTAFPSVSQPAVSQPTWPGMSATPAPSQRDATIELIRQFQMHRASQEVLPNTVQLQAPQPPAAGSPADMPLLLAQAMSVPLASAFIQSMFGGNPHPQPPVVQPGVFPAAGGTMNPLLQLMQKAMQPAPVVPGVSPGISPILPGHSPSPLLSAPHQNSPAPTPSTSGLQIQLPPMDTSVAKALLLQLAEQLQRAGQLPNDDSFQKLLRSVQSPVTSSANSAATPTAIKTEIKAEPTSNSSYEQKPQLPVVAKILKREPDPEKPICVVSNTQGSSGKHPSPVVDTKASKKPGVYIDVAEPAQMHGGSDSENDDVNFPDDNSSGSDSRPLATVTSDMKKFPSLKEPQAKMKTPGPKCNSAVLVSRPSSSGSTQYKSHGMYNYCDGVKYDCNIKLKKCAVKLKRVNMEKYLQTRKNPPAAQVTPPPKEKDRVALLKQHKFSSAAVLLPPLPPVSSMPVNSQPVANKTEFMPPGSVLFGQPNRVTDIRNVPVTFGSSGQARIPMEMKPTALAMGKPESLLSSSSSTVTSVSHLSTVKNETVWNRNVGLGRSSTQMANTQLVPLKVTTKPSINASANHQLRSMYMGLVASNMEWLSLVSCTRGTGKQQYCQCIFCPAVGDMPRDVALHINANHAELSWALSKLKPAAGSLLYINCRHCDFVTVEPTVLWIHFEIHHDISGILDSNCPGQLDLSKPDPPMQMVNLDESLPMVSSFVCNDCGAVNTDFDTTAGSMVMARHIVRDHPHTANFNGCFVKLIMLQRVEGDPDSIKGSVTYRQAIYDKEHVRGRRDVFVCMLCRYSAFCSYLALSHSVSSHQTKRMLYVCSECSYQCLSDTDAVQHMTREHRRRSPLSSSLVCSATLVERTPLGDSYLECPVTVNRASSLNLVTAQPATPQQTTQPATTKNAGARSKKQKAKKTKDSDSNDDDDELQDKVQRKQKRCRKRSRSNSVDSDKDVVPSKKKVKRKRQASESSGTSETNDSDCAASSKRHVKAKSKSRSRRSADSEEDESDAQSRKQARSVAGRKKPAMQKMATAKEDSDVEGDEEDEERKKSFKLQSTKISSSGDKVSGCSKNDTSSRSVSAVCVNEQSRDRDGKSVSNLVDITTQGHELEQFDADINDGKDCEEKSVGKEQVNSDDMNEVIAATAVATATASTITSDEPANDKEDSAENNVAETVAELPVSVDTCKNAGTDVVSCQVEGSADEIMETSRDGDESRNSSVSEAVDSAASFSSAAPREEHVPFGDDIPSTTVDKTAAELDIGNVVAAAGTLSGDTAAQKVSITTCDTAVTAALLTCVNDSIRSTDLPKVTD